MNTTMAIVVLAVAIATQEQEDPKVYLTSRSTGSTWNALRDQSQEMAKDFASDCVGVQVATNPQDADYTVVLNHVEVGWFVRDNQITVTDLAGNVLATKENSSIGRGVKGACSLIKDDWSNTARSAQRLIEGINAGFRRDRVIGYAEVSGDKLTVHSERASAMRFHMILASQREMIYIRRAGIATYTYTNDTDQKFVYDMKSSQIVSTSQEHSESGSATEGAQER